MCDHVVAGGSRPYPIRHTTRTPRDQTTRHEPETPLGHPRRRRDQRPADARVPGVAAPPTCGPSPAARWRRPRPPPTQHGIPTAYGSYEELLADPEHRRRVHPAAEPPARRVDAEGRRRRQARPVREAADLRRDASAEELVAYCRAKGVRLMDGFMWPHHPRTHKLRQFLDSGAIGEVQEGGRRVHVQPGPGCRRRTSACSRRPAAAGCWTWAATPSTPSAGGCGRSR